MYKITVRTGQILSCENNNGKVLIKNTSDGIVLEFDDKIIVRCQRTSDNDQYSAAFGYDVIFTIKDDVFTDVTVQRNEKCYGQSPPDVINRRKTADIIYAYGVIYQVSISNVKK